MKTKSDITNIEEKIGVIFIKKELLQEAFTHRSYLNEKPSWPTPNNERLEFLGDAVLELIITEALFELFPEEPEGQLTSLRSALVNYQMMSKISRNLDLEKHILLSKGESKDLGKAREVILANLSEALIGAIYLDQGYAVAQTFVKKHVLVHLEEVLKNKTYKDPKSLLQEAIQEKMKMTPAYKILNEHGPDHQKKFVVGVYFGDDLIAEGKGTSKQEAERNAAASALQKIEQND